MTGTFYHHVKRSIRKFFYDLLNSEVDNLYLDSENENIEGDKVVIVWSSIARVEDLVSTIVRDTIQIDVFCKNEVDLDNIVKTIIDNLQDRKIDIFDELGGKIGEIYIRTVSASALEPFGEYKSHLIRADYEYIE